MILFLSTADTDLLTLAEATADLPRDLEVVATNPADFADEDMAAAFVDPLLPRLDLAVLRLHGGRRALPGFDRLLQQVASRRIPCLALPGDVEPDPELDEATTVPRDVAGDALAYLLHGGVGNMGALFRFLSDRLLGTHFGYEAAQPLPWHGIYRPERREPLDLATFLREFPAEGPVVGILFYRAHWMSRNLQVIDALVAALEQEGARALPIFCYSLKPAEGERLPAFARELLLREGRPVVDALVSTLSFAGGRVDLSREHVVAAFESELFRTLDVPVLQAIVATGSEAAWEASRQGLDPVDVAMNVAMPEFDGRLITVPISFKEEVAEAKLSGARVRRYVPRPDRVAFVAQLAKRHADLRRLPNHAKRIAVLLTNYPNKVSRIGNAVGLDTPASVVRLLQELKARGYDVRDIPQDGDALIHAIIERCSNDSAYLTEEQLRLAAGHLAGDRYRARYASLPEATQAELRATWGEPPGTVLTFGDDIVIPGIQLGNVFVGLQPPRGFGDNPIAVYHSPDLVPTHQYIGYYQWLRDVFGAHAVVHMGKHGTLEWLPGKGIGLSPACYPEVVLETLPNFYPYIINNPGEGTQAKRRSHATIVDHMIPPMTTADTYDALSELEQLLDQYYQVETLDPKKLPDIEEEIWHTIRRAELHRDLGTEERPDTSAFGDFLAHVDGYLCELKAAQIRDGLHVLGTLPESTAARVDLLLMLLRLPTGDLPSLPDALRSGLGLPPRDADAPLGAHYEGELPAALLPFLPPRPTLGDIEGALEALGRTLLTHLLEPAAPDAVADALALLPVSAHDAVRGLLTFVVTTLWPRLKETEEEVRRLADGLDGHFVRPGPSGAPTRGMADILPTGRNFYSVDPRTIPSPTAWRVGQRLAERLVARYLEEEGTYPESVGIVVWGTAAMRTQGDDVAEVLALLGVRPVWQKESRRLVGLEPIPLPELGRPRIDVTVRMSGFFRDAFPNVIRLLDRAVRLVAALPEGPEDNFVRKHVQAEAREKEAEGMDSAAAEETSLLRIFGAKPGSYGSGLLPLIEGGHWQGDDDLARVYVTWSGYAYSEQHHGLPAAAEFRRRLARLQVATKNQDNREHDIFDSDDYFQDHGGMVASIRALAGRAPKAYFGDSHDPGRITVRDLKEEARRVFRSRVVNPKWLASIMRHGYKGALELAATVDYLFGYDATAGVVEDWMYRDLGRAYVTDPTMRAFLMEKNPWALKDIAERLLEAADRGLWAEPDPQLLAELEEAVLAAETSLEGRLEGRP